jgi:hypothetical protein
MGWRLIQPNVVQMYGMGDALPQEIDLWFRAHTYDADEPVVELAPKRDTSIQFDQTQLTIKEIQRGYRGWSSADGFLPVEGEYFDNFAIEIEGKTSPPATHKYQLAAVLKDGRKEIDDRFYRFNQTMVVDFDYPLEAVDHFEIRRYGGRAPFFFDGIQLPVVNIQAIRFSDPPSAILPIAGRPANERPVNALAPLDVRIAVYDGSPFGGSMGTSWNAHLTRRANGPQDVGESFTLTLRSFGLSRLKSVTVEYRSLDDQNWVPLSKPSRGLAASSGANAVQARVYRLPLKNVDEIKLKPLPGG